MKRKLIVRTIGVAFAVFLAAIIVSVIFVLNPRDIDQSDAEELFGEYICSPIPEGVYGLDATGRFSMASQYFPDSMVETPRDFLQPRRR